MTSAVPTGPPIPSTPSDAASSLSWEGDKMFNIYIYDYCSKRGFRKTARELLSEADIPPDSTPPINARQGLLFEWWSVFWVLFTAKANGNGPEEAMIYTQHQAQQAANRQRQAQSATIGPQGSQPGMQQQSMRGMNGMPPNQPRFQPNGPMPNGVGPGGIPPGSLPPGAPGFPIGGGSGPQMNGIPGPPGPPTATNFQPMIPGQRPPMGGPQQRGVVNGGPPFPTDPSSQNPGQPNPQTPQQGQQQQPPMNRMLPPNGIPQAPTPNSSYPQMGRPPSRTATPSGMMTTQSPSLMNRQPPMDINAEWSKIPHQVLMSLKAEVGLDGKDLMLLSIEDKQRVLNHHRSKTARNQKPGQPNAAAGPSNPMMPPTQQRGPAGRPTKRNSTSPGDEQEANQAGSSPPDRKRVRRSPMEQNAMTPMNYSQVPQQQPPPPGGPQQPMNMVRMQGGPPPQNGFNPGMPPGMMNPMMGMGQPPLGAPMGGMSPAMGAIPNQGGMMNPQMQMHGMPGRDGNQYRQSMQGMHGRGMMPQQPGMVPNPGMPNAGSPAADSGFNPGGPGGPPFNPPPGAGGPPPPPPAGGAGPPNGRMGAPPPPQQKPMSMLHPPPSPGMAKDQSKDGVKPEASPRNLPESIPTGPTGTAPATPVTTTNPGAMDTSSLLPMGTNDMLFSNEFVNNLASSLDEFDPASMFGRPDGLGSDINFERDFGQWFDPNDALTGGLDISK